jgi:glycosyltransferase involved in cell wall biosynthesis
MEVMALGLPVVSTNVGGIPYLLTDKENALLVDDNDDKAMTEAILDLLNDKGKANQLAQNARIFIEQMDWQVVKQSWGSILKIV